VYNIFAAFTLTPNGGTEEKVFLMRNPWGTTTYSSDWNKNDARWDATTKARVPFGIDPTTDHNRGYFVTTPDKFINNACFYDYYITHDIAGDHKVIRYDKIGADE
jgi:hypothetical protein